MDDTILFILGVVVGGLIVFLLFGKPYSYSRFGYNISKISLSPIPKVVNKEEWRWIDYKGRERVIVVTRELHEG